jgi:uncharacterized protein (TIGR02217 family)
VQFPTTIAVEYTGGAEYRVLVNRADSMSEQRMLLNTRPFHTYEISSGPKKPADKQALIQFWHARRGMAYAFRLKDWNDYSTNPAPTNASTSFLYTNNQLLANLDNTHFQLQVTYQDSASSLVRKIECPVYGTSPTKNFVGILLYKAASTTPLVEGTDYTVDYVGNAAGFGVVTLTTPDSTNPYYWNGEWDVPCRFDTQGMKMGRVENTSFLWDGIQMVEAFQT